MKSNDPQEMQRLEIPRLAAEHIAVNLFGVREIPRLVFLQGEGHCLLDRRLYG